jgi:hypothetical protein
VALEVGGRERELRQHAFVAPNGLRQGRIAQHARRHDDIGAVGARERELELLDVAGREDFLDRRRAGKACAFEARAEHWTPRVEGQRACERRCARHTPRRRVVGVVERARRRTNARATSACR